MIDQMNHTIPTANIQPQRQFTWAWLIPIFAVVLAGYLAFHSYSRRGQSIAIQLERGFGLTVGDHVRYRGIQVGTVTELELINEPVSVLVTANLMPEFRHLAKAGSRFWVVRPQVGVTGVAGLDTIVGPRYLAMVPGDGLPQLHFMGQSEPPAVESVDPDDLEIILHTLQRGGLRPGAPVLYRQVPIGTVLSVGLAGDSSAVEARLTIEKAYVELIRPETRFWTSGGFEAQLGLRGFSLQLDSVETLLSGGVSLATPNGAQDVVRNGHRFPLHSKPEEEWLAWEPLLPIGSSLLPPGSPLPNPLRAVLGWEQGRWITSEKSRRGWILQTEKGLLGPADLLTVTKKADENTAFLEVLGRRITLTQKPAWSANGLVLLEVELSDRHWPRWRERTADKIEDCLAVADPTASPFPLMAMRLKAGKGRWEIDPIISLDESWHGACVLSRDDGRLVGMIVYENDRPHVALLPAASVRTGFAPINP